METRPFFGIMDSYDLDYNREMIYRRIQLYLDDLETFKSKDVLLLIQLLKENLIFWSSEMNEEEQN